jgi:hypothetical protein
MSSHGDERMGMLYIRDVKLDPENDSEGVQMTKWRIITSVAGVVLVDTLLSARTVFRILYCMCQQSPVVLLKSQSSFTALVYLLRRTPSLEPGLIVCSRANWSCMSIHPFMLASQLPTAASPSSHPSKFSFPIREHTSSQLCPERLRYLS